MDPHIILALTVFFHFKTFQLQNTCHGSSSFTLLIITKISKHYCWKDQTVLFKIPLWTAMMLIPCDFKLFVRRITHLLLFDRMLLHIDHSRKHSGVQKSESTNKNASIFYSFYILSFKITHNCTFITSWEFLDTSPLHLWLA